MEQLEQKNIILVRGEEFKADEDGFVSFGEVAGKILEGTTQQISRYADGRLEEDGFPNLGEGLRFKGKMDAYHFLRIHKDNIEEFAQRVEKHWDEHR